MKYKVLSFEEAMRLGFDGEFVGYYNYEYRSGVFRMEDDKPVEMLGHDGGEPEDQTLWRDWSWVATALIAAYKRGRAERE